MRTRQTLAVAICCLTLNTQAQILKEQLWDYRYLVTTIGAYTGGEIYSVVEDTVNEIVYVGGRFTHMGPRVTYGAVLDPITGQPDLQAPQPNGYVHACIPDGEGGWYIGGAFTAIGGVTRNGVARLNADGSVHAWDPDANGSVRALYLEGSTLYLGGIFNSLGGATRNNIAAVDVATGNVTAWDPNANGSVWTIEVSGTTVFIGGSFTTIDGLTRNRIAALDISTGDPTAWDPNANDHIRSLVVSGGIIYAGGNFTNIGGELRNRIAALDVSTGNATPWDPNAGGNVFSLAINGNVVYVGGGFFNIGGVSRLNIAALDATTGAPTAWNPGCDAPPQTMLLSGNNLYIGGNFTSAGGVLRNGIAALDATTGDIVSWDPDTGGHQVHCIALSGGSIYAGGTFVAIGYRPRNHIAAFDANTGMPTSWEPDPDNEVTAIALSDGIVYVGGHFENIGGQSRNKIAALDASTGLATAWNPNVASTSFGSSIHAILPAEEIIYVCGHFGGIGGQARKNIAALNASTGLATSWDPAGDDLIYIYSMALSGSTMYVGGNFTSLGGQARNKIAALDVTTGLATPWNPNANDAVRTLTLSGSTVHVGGDFTTIGGATRNRLAALDATTGLATFWNPNANDRVTAMALDGNTLYVGGMFTSISGQPRNYLTSVDITTGDPTAWQPEPSDFSLNAIDVLAVYGSTLYAGGRFRQISGQPWRAGFAGFALCTEGSTCDADPAPGQYVLGQLDAICNCVASPCTENVVIEFQTDANGEEISWEIAPQGSEQVVCSGEGLSDNAVVTVDCCLISGCYKFTVYDSAGDGMSTGGYILRSDNGDRIIDNRNNFNTGFESSISGDQSFCVPVGIDRPIHTSCDKLHWDNNEFLVASLNPAVSAEYLPGMPNSAQDTNSGYMFWFYDPNGSYSYIHFRTHATSHGYPASGPARAAHLRLNNWAPVNHLPVGVLLNVRVRGVLNGNWMGWGPACRFMLDPVAAACPPTKLLDIPFHPYLSCGQAREFATGSYVHARPVSGASQYQFRFRQPAEGYEKIRQNTSYFVQLWWAVDPLVAGSQYQVDVRAFKNGEWCPWGEVCTLNIGADPGAQGGAQQNMMSSTDGAELNMWPNPNRGDQLYISLSEVPDGTSIVIVEMFDLYGKKVMARTVTTSDSFLNTVIDLDGAMAAGIYMVNITTGESTYTQRLVIQK